MDERDGRGRREGESGREERRREGWRREGEGGREGWRREESEREGKREEMRRDTHEQSVDLLITAINRDR